MLMQRQVLFLEDLFFDFKFSIVLNMNNYFLNLTIFVVVFFIFFCFSFHVFCSEIFIFCIVKKKGRHFKVSIFNIFIYR